MDCCMWIPCLVVLYLLLNWFYRRLNISGYSDRHVFITGCDSGFGEILACRLDRMGFRVFAACLTEAGENKLRKKASDRLVTLPLDVTKERSIRKAEQFVREKLPPNTGLWCVVNNAGIAGAVGLSEWLSKEDFENTLAVNLYGVIDTTRIFLPLVRAARGRIVNMASILGTVSMPGASPYCIAKHGVEVYSDCLRMEVRSHGVSVHIVEPGYFGTGIAHPDAIKEAMLKTFNKMDPATQKFYGSDYLSKTDVNSFLDLVTSPDLDKVVNCYIHAVTARFPKYRYRVGWDAHTIFRLVQWCPEWLGDYIFSSQLAKPQGL